MTSKGLWPNYCREYGWEHEPTSPCRLCGAMPVWRVAERVYAPQEVGAAQTDRYYMVLVCRNCGIRPCAGYREVVATSDGTWRQAVRLWNSYQNEKESI